MTLRTRLSIEWLEQRDNPSVPGGEAPYTEPTSPPPDDTTTTVVDTGAGAVGGAAGTTPTDPNSPTGTSNLPYYP